MLPWSSALRKDTLEKKGRKLPSLNRIKPFSKKILAWYVTDGRDFRWRRDGISLYEVIVTESLLQRTRAETVEQFLPVFLSKYPEWEAIADKSLPELEADLKPIGLQSRRASSLSALAHSIVNDFKGEVPLVDEELASLAGVGQYVFCAVKMYRHNAPEPLLDASMARLVERYFGARQMADIRYDPYLQQLCRKILSTDEPRSLNWAMLDFAALVCKQREPRCADCVLEPLCKFNK